YSRATRGWRSASSQASASASAKTIEPTFARSTAPESSRTSSPKRSAIAARTSSSSRRRRWTISSLERIGTPRRASASNASLLPAPIPPVIATATGRAKLLLAGGRRLFRGRLGGRRRRLDRLGRSLGLQLGLRRGLGLRRR